MLARTLAARELTGRRPSGCLHALRVHQRHDAFQFETADGRDDISWGLTTLAAHPGTGMCAAYAASPTTYYGFIRLRGASGAAACVEAPECVFDIAFSADAHWLMHTTRGGFMMHPLGAAASERLFTTGAGGHAKRVTPLSEALVLTAGRGAHCCVWDVRCAGGPVVALPAPACEARTHLCFTCAAPTGTHAILAGTDVMGGSVYAYDLRRAAEGPVCTLHTPAASARRGVIDVAVLRQHVAILHCSGVLSLVPRGGLAFGEGRCAHQVRCCAAPVACLATDRFSQRALASAAGDMVACATDGGFIVVSDSGAVRGDGRRFTDRGMAYMAWAGEGRLLVLEGGTQSAEPLAVEEGAVLRCRPSRAA